MREPSTYFTLELVEQVGKWPPGTQATALLEADDGSYYVVEVHGAQEVVPIDQVGDAKVIQIFEDGTALVEHFEPETFDVKFGQFKIVWPLTFYYGGGPPQCWLVDDDDKAYREQRWTKIAGSEHFRLVRLRSSMVWWSDTVRQALDCWAADWRYNITTGEDIEVLLRADDQTIPRFLAEVAEGDPDALLDPDDLKAGLEIVRRQPLINRFGVPRDLRPEIPADYVWLSDDELRAIAGLPPMERDPWWDDFNKAGDR